MGQYNMREIDIDEASGLPVLPKDHYWEITKSLFVAYGYNVMHIHLMKRTTISWKEPHKVIPFKKVTMTRDSERELMSWMVTFPNNRIVPVRFEDISDSLFKDSVLDAYQQWNKQIVEESPNKFLGIWDTGRKD